MARARHREMAGVVRDVGRGRITQGSPVLRKILDFKCDGKPLEPFGQFGDL